jgi:hypothetical protein
MTETAARYRRWAESEALGFSAIYERLGLAVADDPAALSFLDSLTHRERQPNLLFAVFRWYDVDVADPAGCLRWLGEHTELVRRELAGRRTQTNEAARCATLLPALALLPQPIALIEVGASAGLCLLYDRWRYHYLGVGVDAWVGPVDGPVTLTCQVVGSVPLPAVVPTIAWRAGLELNPLDPADPETVRWLQCLVWPEHTDRAARLTAALSVAAAAAPPVSTGDAVEDLPALIEAAPAGCTIVVQHSAALAYLEPARREAFRQIVAEHGAHRLGAEGGNQLDFLRYPDGVSREGHFVISLDDEALGFADPHGRSLAWF